MVIANRNMQRGSELAANIAGAEAVPIAAVASGEVHGHVLLNSTSVGMGSTEGQSLMEVEAVAKVGGACVIEGGEQQEGWSSWG